MTVHRSPLGPPRVFACPFAAYGILVQIAVVTALITQARDRDGKEAGY
jgi:hypothetical protein